MTTWAGTRSKYPSSSSRLFIVPVGLFGWQTKTGAQDQYAVKESEQATFLRQSVRLFQRQFPRVGTLIWFLIKDEPVESEDGRQNTWQSGFRRLDGTKKPAYATWQQLAGAARRP